MKKILLLAAFLAISSLGEMNISQHKKEAIFDGVIYFSSENVADKEDDGGNDEENPTRYEIYDGDESSNFTDAIDLDINTEYEFCFNTRRDVDYFKYETNPGDVISIDCSTYADLDVFKQVDTSYIGYFTDQISSNTKIVFDSNEVFYFKITGPSLYTGPYTLELIEHTISSATLNSNYVRLEFNSTNIVSSELITFTDFGNLPTSASKSGYCGSYNNNQFSLDYYNGMLLSTYAASNNLNYISSMYGVFNNSNIATGLPSDDGRKIYNYDNYLYSCTPYTVSTFTSSYLYDRRATSFFVDDDYAFTAAHMVCDSENNDIRFSNNIYLTTSKYPSNSLNVYDIPCLELYLPYGFIYHSINNSSADTCRYYDWCLMKLDTSVLPSTYVHSYLGVAYPLNTNLSYYNVGYPVYSYVYQNQYTLTDVHFDRYSILAGSYGSVYTQNNLIKTYIDLTNGHSGGPCLYKDNNDLGVAVGIVSGNNQDGAGNIFSTINEYNYAILSKYLLGVI